SARPARRPLEVVGVEDDERTSSIGARQPAGNRAAVADGLEGVDDIRAKAADLAQHVPDDHGTGQRPRPEASMNDLDAVLGPPLARAAGVVPGRDNEADHG